MKPIKITVRLTKLGLTLNETKPHKPSQSKLRKQLNSIKREQFPFMLEVTKCSPQLAICN
ncbi:hypothetical protein I6G26_05540 [Moraxella nonliquefaciens]|nr:hypothetical protein [Moraxella nonliquefaciens]QPT45439.1 hypothetical protein I6G26_05540 [Moraxella nonliquefaciens]QQC30472.1 hypothetical protein I6H63_04330 [Moraxella nonliquefaciens]